MDAQKLAGSERPAAALLCANVLLIVDGNEKEKGMYSGISGSWFKKGVRSKVQVVGNSLHSGSLSSSPLLFLVVPGVGYALTGSRSNYRALFSRG